ncbi:hypothetical protein DACRYDRAFT_119591 [Dacryopinax primogenitus]|uniref:RING-type domain-containing protein n=1 Tax=Dacryopinax primogenitus (strain DJM 731) TaxID=1858805 RepID=M5FUZ6_DACPD|nr:uncharacterized protein DACRYDRAFT_119591 [Dacryopinax primogenitus]EJT97111.1 hypothetical protein DACRYDRAFT_119591 [Dacryopinax primogenitus]
MGANLVHVHEPSLQSPHEQTTTSLGSLQFSDILASSSTSSLRIREYPHRQREMVVPLIWQESTHTIDVRPLDREACIEQSRAVRRFLDIPLLTKFIDGSYKDISEEKADKRNRFVKLMGKGNGARGTKRQREGGGDSRSSRKKAKRNSGKAAPPVAVVNDIEDIIITESVPDISMDDNTPDPVTNEHQHTSNDAVHAVAAEPAPTKPMFTLLLQVNLKLVCGTEAANFSPSSKLHKLCSLNTLHKDEEGLIALIQRLLHHTPSSSGPIELGHVNLRPWGTNLHVHGRINDKRETLPMFTFKPPVPFGGEAEDWDFPIPVYSSSSSILHAALHLCGLPEPRVRIHAILLADNAVITTWRGKQAPLGVQFYLSVSLDILPSMLSDPGSLPLPAQEAQRLLLSHVFSPPPGPPNYPGSTNIHWFYELLGPAPDLPEGEEARYQPEKLDANLLPFQRRSVAWLLQREGVLLPPTSHGSSIPPVEDACFLYQRALSPFVPAEKELWFSPLMGSLLPSPPSDLAIRAGADGIIGGMLSEEMGLGKTLECLALILLSPPPVSRGPETVRAQMVYDLSGEARETRVREVGTTLIVSPASLQQQWADEIALHAPELKVLVYKGWKKEIEGVGKERRSGGRTKGTKDEEEKENDDDTFLSTWATATHKYDIVLTTYDDIRKEFYVSQPRKPRPKRDTAVYTHPEGADAVIRSPLVSVEWWRVVMDEVQQQGDGKAASVVSLIPRRSSVAISGTPVDDEIRDLFQVLKFLRVPILSDSPRLWTRLLKPAFAPHFQELFQRIGIRTLKKKVADELTIPPQRRYLVPVELGPVERHLYNDLLDSAYSALGVDSLGNALGGSGELEVSQLRTWLLRLRQSCTHPQIGQMHRNDRVLGGALRTIGEVLELMRYQNRQIILNEKRDRLAHRVRLALMLQLDESNAARWKQSLELFLALKSDVQSLVDEVKGILDVQIFAARAERKAAREKANGLSDSYLLEDGSRPAKRKGKDVEPDGYETDDDDEWAHDEETAEESKGRGVHKENRVKTSHVRIRECFVLQHKIFFSLGDLYHKVAKQEEDAAYADAETVRRAVLKNTEDLALRAMYKLTHEVAEKGVNERELEVELCGKPGLRAGLLFDEANDIIELLNDQRELLWKWRGMIYTRLTQKLTTAEGEEASGEEYTHALDAQGEAEAYIVVYAALLADRKEALSQERTILAVHESREKKARDTRAALNAGLENTLSGAPAAMEPQNEVLMRQLTDERRSMRDAHSKRSLKNVFPEMSGLADRHDKEMEGVILRSEAMRLRRIVTDQDVLCSRLESELAIFRQAFNGRIVYFRQLQELSDSVMDFDVKELGVQSLAEAIREAEEKVHKFDDTLRTLQAKQRYLEYMDEGQTNEALGMDNTETRECVLCACGFENGCLTACGHIYCEDCLNAWLKKRGTKFCPVCRQPLSKQTIHRIVFHAGEKVDEGEELVEPEGAHIDYNVMDLELLREIDDIEAHGNYGSKVQALVKHLLYLKKKEPEAKSIVFSAWMDSLNIIARALQENDISCIRVEAGRNAAREFRLDPVCRVLLLHGERENAGLNVTCANRVFLLEPVVNHAFEVQAIGRVDRMGQTRNTEVYCYYAIDTVEKGVLDLAARKGVSIYTKGHARGTLNMSELGDEGLRNSPRKGPKGKGDFMAKTDDMMAIVFPHLAEVPHDGSVIEVDIDAEEEMQREIQRRQAAAAAERRKAMQAGPSSRQEAG